VSDACIHSFVRMGTVVTLRVLVPKTTGNGKRGLTDAVARAAGWFQRVEDACSRFDEHSELRRLSTRIGIPVPVSETLFQAVQFALKVAGETGGAFDPTVGQRMAARGFNRDYRNGRIVRTPVPAGEPASYRDVRLDPEARTITLLRPLVLDLGAVAKGLAVDLAARELRPFENFTIDAGGDLYLAGCNAGGKPWSVGIRHPRDEHALIHTFFLSDAAVCTSGDYERPGTAADGGHHLMDPRTGQAATTAASVTVIAPSAMLADTLGTAAFVLGHAAGLELLENSGVGGLIVTPALERFMTRGLGHE
jgi:thiamine biosynthesis lipoprotein